MEIVLTVGVGLTVIVKLIGVPEHPFAEGVTRIVATTGEVPVLPAANAAISPVPLAASPILAALLVHAKVVPLTPPVKANAGVVPPLQRAALPTCSTVGVGLTVMVKINGVPTQLFPVGVMVIVAVTGVVPLFVAVNDGIDAEVPLEANPMDGVSLVQAKVAPDTLLPNGIAGTEVPLQYCRLAIALTVGIGLTVIVKVIGAPAQPFA